MHRIKDPLLPLFKIIAFVIFLLVLNPGAMLAQQTKKRMSVHMDVQRLNKGKVVKVNADIYFKYIEGLMTIHYLYPMDYVLITNKIGEAKMYVPKTNEVVVQMNEAFSSSSEAIYYFLSDKYNDLGLKESGFTMRNTRRDNEYLVSEWFPPISAASAISKVEIVSKDYLPVYSAIYNSKSLVIKKTFFSNYYTGNQGSFPQRITEIEYFKTGDSIVSRKEYTNAKFDLEASSSYFDYKIPQNAKLITDIKNK
jgi:hypothetical protein